MSNHVLDKLEKRIDDVIESLAILGLQVEELEANNRALQSENGALKNRQAHWEQSLTTLLGKLDEATEASLQQEVNRIEQFEREEAEAVA